MDGKWMLAEHQVKGQERWLVYDGCLPDEETENAAEQEFSYQTEASENSKISGSGNKCEFSFPSLASSQDLFFFPIGILYAICLFLTSTIHTDKKAWPPPPLLPTTYLVLYRSLSTGNEERKTQDSEQWALGLVTKEELAARRGPARGVVLNTVDLQSPWKQKGSPRGSNQTPPSSSLV